MKMEAETTKSPPGSDTSSLDTCGVCKELFHSRDPKLLPCLHSFCRSCIVPKANDSGVVQCPVCQVESKLSDMVDWLCVSRDRGGAVSGGGAGAGDGSAQEEIHICTGCEENAAASSYCTDCPEWLCDQCVQAHRRVRVTKDHTIEPKENVTNRPNSACSSSSSSSAAAQVIHFCPQHVHEPLKLFCETCDKLTCRDCQLGDHKDHKYQFVNEASTQYKQFLQILLSKIKEKQTYIENAYQLIHKRHQEIEEREKVVLNDIKAFAKRLMSEVNNRGKQLVTDLHSICTAKKAQLGYKQKAIVTLSGQLAHSLMMAEKILDCNNTAAMLSSKKLLVQHLKHLLRTRCEVPNPYHVVDINLQYSEDLICGYLSKQGSLVVDGVTFRGSNKTPKPAKTPSSASGAGGQQTSQAQVSSQQQPQQGRPLQPIAPKLVPGHGPPPNLSMLTMEQRASLVKSIAVKHMQTGGNSPTSTVTNPLFPNPMRSAGSAGPPGAAPSSSSASSSNGAARKFHQPYMQVSQSNAVSSTQVVKTGGVYYPPSGLPQPQTQTQTQTQAGQQAAGGSRRTLTVQQQLLQQRQRLHEQQQQQQRYQQHMSQIKHQMDKMVQELQRQQHKPGSSTPQQPGLAAATPQLAGLPGRPQGMGNPSMANAIIIQPASSSGNYPISSTQPGFTSQMSIGNGRDQLTPSPNLRTSPLSQGSRNEVSPVGSLSEGLSNTSDTCVTGVKLNSTMSSIKQEQLDLYSQILGPDGTLCIKPEPQTPGAEGVSLSYPTDLSYDDNFLTDLRSKPVDDSEMPDSAIELTQRTPPPMTSQQFAANQDQPYNLCKPITDQVIGCQDGDASEVLDLSRGAGDAPKPAESGSRPQAVLGTIKSVIDERQVESEPLPLRDPDDPSEDYCAVCQNGGELLCCDTCPKVFHLTCHVPTLSTEPSGTWSCVLCTRESELKIESALPRPTEAVGSKRKMSMEKLLDREMKVCQRILLELFCNKASPLFHEPVPKSVPNYHKIISTPMDLGTIKAKLGRTHGPRYITIDDFLGDIQLVFTNCTIFNDPESQVGKAGKIMEGFFHDLVNKYLPYFRAWTASPHDYQVDLKEATKAKRRKRDLSGKDAKEPRGTKDKSLHPEGQRVRGKSPIPRDKTSRKSSDRPQDQSDYKDSAFATVQDEGATDLSNPFVSEDTEDALIRNLGLIRNQCEQISAGSDPEPQDLPSDPVIDPNDVDSSLEIIEPMDTTEPVKDDGTEEVDEVVKAAADEGDLMDADELPRKDSEEEEVKDTEQEKSKDGSEQDVSDSQQADKEPETEKDPSVDESAKCTPDADASKPSTDSEKVKEVGEEVSEVCQVTDEGAEKVQEDVSEEAQDKQQQKEKEQPQKEEQQEEEQQKEEQQPEMSAGEGAAKDDDTLPTGDKDSEQDGDQTPPDKDSDVAENKSTEPSGAAASGEDEQPSVTSPANETTSPPAGLVDEDNNPANKPEESPADQPTDSAAS